MSPAHSTFPGWCCVFYGVTPMPHAPQRPAPADDVGDESARVLSTGGPPDTDAEFTAFMQAHSADLLRTAWLLVGDAHRAEELVQHALVRTYASWSRTRGDDPLAYTRRTLVNLRIDTWRRRRREVLSAPEHLPEGSSAGRSARPTTATSWSAPSPCCPRGSAGSSCCGTSSGSPRPRWPPSSASASAP